MKDGENMKLKGRFRYVGGQTGTTANGKVYYLMSLLQGLDTTRIYVSEEFYVKDLSKIPEFSEVDCELNISQGAKGTYINCESITPVVKK